MLLRVARRGMAALVCAILVSSRGPTVLARFAPAAGPSPSPSIDEQLTIDRNLGKAIYEKPTTQTEAVAEIKKALDLRPDSVREQLNNGLALLRAAKTQEAVAMLEIVQ